MRFIAKLHLSIFILSIAPFAGCNVTATPVTRNQQPPIRAAVLEFTTALRTGDPAQLQQTTTVDANPQTRQLADTVAGDTIAARNLHLQLQRKFQDSEHKAAIIGTDDWIAQFEQTAASDPVFQAGDRVRVGQPGTSQAIYLRQVHGQWKVELIPTLVAECNGMPRISDPIVDYRFQVSRAVHEHLLGRVARSEFASLHDYQQAKNEFWFEYMTCASKGDDPHDKLLATLPPLPKESELFSTER